MARWTFRMAIVAAALAASVTPAARASVIKQVPCTKVSNGKYGCSFYPPGDGISGGAPVQNHRGKVVGYLNEGRNWIVCQASGVTVHYHGYYNHFWGFTVANDGNKGWVNAVYVSGGSNNGPFSAIVPDCHFKLRSPPKHTSPPPRRTRKPMPPPPDQRTQAQVPCRSIGGGKHQCRFWPAGDGIHHGAPVQNHRGKVVGRLNQGSNWVICERSGATIKRGSLANYWWAWTEANDHKRGWVNALYGQGGDNYGDFMGVPPCSTNHGYPPGGAPPPPPRPKPKPTPPPPIIGSIPHFVTVTNNTTCPHIEFIAAAGSGETDAGTVLTQLHSDFVTA
ncbi:MAG: hypothetical protein J2P50_20880, partial [Hyphomicrobiaceae bacterium]|nr:hypothetical protein [Hyphomicrobiaceae bacterium]